MSVVIAAGLVGTSAVRAARARSRAHAASAAFEQTRAIAAEVLALRGTRPTLALGKRPQPGIYGQFTDALVDAGEPTTVLTSLTPDSDSVVEAEGTARKRQRVRVTLEGITLPRLGGVLIAWRRAQPEWTVTHIQLTPASPGTPPPENAPRPLRVTLLMEAIYLESPGATPS